MAPEDIIIIKSINYHSGSRKVGIFNKEKNPGFIEERGLQTVWMWYFFYLIKHTALFLMIQYFNFTCLSDI